MRYVMPYAGDQALLWDAVAALPCMVPGCGRNGRTQVSHSNKSRDGKGGALKAYPWCVAAICDDCHVQIDSGSVLTREERRALWDQAHIGTLHALFAAGRLRPFRLPIPSVQETYL